MPLNYGKPLVFTPIILFAFGLRLWGVNARSLWFDESFEYWASIVEWQDLPATVTTSFQPPLYNFLLHFWLDFGSDEVWLRFLSVAFSLLSLVGVMILGYRLMGPVGAMFAGLMMAVFPTEIKYAQEVSEYALMGFALSWSLLALFYALRVSTWKAWGIWGIFCVLAVYSHYGAAITVIASSMLALIENIVRRKLNGLSKQVSVMFLCFILGIPLLYFLPRQLQVQQQVSALREASLSSEISQFFEHSGETFLFPLTGMPFSVLPTWLPLFAVGSPLFLSLLVLPTTNHEVKRLIIGFWGAYLFYYLNVRLSWYAYGNFGFRYMLILLPSFILMIVVVVSQLYQSRLLMVRTIGIGVFVLVITLALYSLPNRTISALTRGYTAWPETQDMREVITYWKQHPSHAAPTYIYYGAAPAFRYYARLYGFEPETLLPPTWYSSCWKGLPVDYCTVGNVYYGVWIRSFSVEDKIISIHKTLRAAPRGRFWLIFSHLYADEDKTIVARLLANYKVEDEFRQINAVAYLLTEQ